MLYCASISGVMKKAVKWTLTRLKKAVDDVDHLKKAGWLTLNEKTAVVDVDDIFHDLKTYLTNLNIQF